jgi:hypothetical protein
MTTERRAADRFPFRREITYKLDGRKGVSFAGTGHTVNMSRAGVLFTTDQHLLVGRNVELSISWPVQLNSAIPLKLVARGKVVRSDDSGTAVEIRYTEFRTQASQKQSIAV